MRVATALVILLGTASASFAAGFDLVVPSKPGVPIMINGVDASYAVVESDFGLGKNSHPQPTVYGGRLVDPELYVGHYYPTLGSRPGYGRMEIEPPAQRKLPQPAESYHQSWGAQSMMQPAQPEVPMNPPNVILAPRGGGGSRSFTTSPPPY
jgi:hypothetical protein